MTETQSKKNTVLDAFLKQREKRQNDTGIQAQKLVNLYRHLALFGDEFLITYNKMLLECAPDVQMALGDIMGGMVVRQYLDFLRTKQQKPDEELDAEEKPSYTTEVSYLPSVDDIEPFQAIPSVMTEVSSEGKQMPAFNDASLKTQGVFLEQALAKQTEFLAQTMSKMQENMAKQSPVIQSSPASESSGASDMAEVLDKILEKQNRILVESLKYVFEHSAEITAKQMETFEQVLQSNLSQNAASYPEIEEYPADMASRSEPETVYIIPEKIKNAPVPPRAYHSEPTEMHNSLSTETESKSVQEIVSKPIEPAVLKKMPTPDEDIEILSEIDLPTKPL